MPMIPAPHPNADVRIHDLQDKFRVEIRYDKKLVDGIYREQEPIVFDVAKEVLSSLVGDRA